MRPETEWNAVIFSVQTIMESKGVRSCSINLHGKEGNTIPSKLRSFNKNYRQEDGSLISETVFVFEPVLLFMVSS